MAPFMLALLALIGLKKFRSFQKPNRIARTFDAFDGRRDGKENKASRGRPRGGGEGRGVSGVWGTAPEPSPGFRKLPETPRYSGAGPEVPCFVSSFHPDPSFSSDLLALACFR